MAESTVAIVGAGVAATAIADRLVAQGHDVTIFEKGPQFPYPHSMQFSEVIHYHHRNPAWDLPADLKRVTVSGDYRRNFDAERGMVVGGSCTHWTGITLRMRPEDFATRSTYGFGVDWPVTYAELEPYYCRAETFLGVSGTDADNPFAPWRSQDYPLPAFELGYDDLLLAERLRADGIALHTTPQARTRAEYDGRPPCQNFGTCEVCPIGARYSPTHHLLRAQSTGRCTVIPNASVRRILTDASGRARAVLYQTGDAPEPREHAAKIIIVAAGALESARLLLLSDSGARPDGLGNAGGHVGRHLVFHHMWYGAIEYEDRLFPGRIGPLTGQCHQFLSPERRGAYGGVKVEFSSHVPVAVPLPKDATSGAEVLATMRAMPHRRAVFLHAESVPDAEKHLRLSEQRDRHGDPFAHVHYASAAFDHETWLYARSLFERIARATHGEPVELDPADEFDSGSHHMGGCRMGREAGDSVVDAFGRVHGSPNLFVVGSATFPGTSGAVNPTLTLLALALRTADHILARL